MESSWASLTKVALQTCERQRPADLRTEPSWKPRVPLARRETRPNSTVSVLHCSRHLLDREPPAVVISAPGNDQFFTLCSALLEVK